MQFEWDPIKAAGNHGKHGITFTEGATVFGDVLAVTFPDNEHSIGEHRFLTIGMSNTGNILIVSHADRGEKTRLISVRKATPKERRFYANQAHN
jgi:uncharacterized DUF497 family protein